MTIQRSTSWNRSASERRSWISGMLFWYWSTSDAKMTKARRLSNAERCSYSASRLPNKLIWFVGSVTLQWRGKKVYNIHLIATKPHPPPQEIILTLSSSPWKQLARNSLNGRWWFANIRCKPGPSGRTEDPWASRKLPSSKRAGHRRMNSNWPAAENGEMRMRTGDS